MLINMRNGLMAGKRLPYDAEVEYLESTGTQWIDTGYTSTARDEVLSASVKLMKINNEAIYASWGTDTSQRLQAFKGSGRIGGNYVLWPPSPVDKKIDIVADIPNTRFLIDGAIFSSTGMTKPDLIMPVSLFVRREAESLFGFADIELYGFTIARGGVLVRDMIPVRFTNEQGVSEGAMYDRANPTIGMNPDGSARTDGLYRNRGTGAFTIGPDI